MALWHVKCLQLKESRKKQKGKGLLTFSTPLSPKQILQPQRSPSVWSLSLLPEAASRPSFEQNPPHIKKKRMSISLKIQVLKEDSEQACLAKLLFHFMSFISRSHSFLPQSPGSRTVYFSPSLMLQTYKLMCFFEF